MPKYIVTTLYLFIGLLILSGCGLDTVQPASGKEKRTSLPKMKAHYIDVGQADATLLQFEDENEAYTMLIDTGNWNTSEVVSYLQNQNVHDIDIIAITHPHADHIGQLDKIIKAFNVTEVWMNGETANSEVFAKALTAIESNDVDYYEPEAGEIFDIGPLEVAVLHPAELSGNTNDNSLAMRLQYGDISFLFTGDGETKAENEMLNGEIKLASTILHVGHHGSKTSTTEPFLLAVNPEVAIYSAGIDNSYAHPDQEVLDLINSKEILLYGTDIHGTVRIETDGVTYTVQMEKDETADEIVEVPETSSNQSCIDINEAPQTEIQHIIHIGPERSKAVIEQRPYNSLNDLSKVKGIGAARINDIKEQGYACIGG